MTLLPDLKRLDKDATPGPWSVKRGDIRREDGWRILEDPQRHEWNEGPIWNQSDPELVVALRNNLPRIIEVLEWADRAREAMALDDDVRRARNRMHDRHYQPVDKRPVEITHDRAPLLEFFGKLTALLDDAPKGD